MMAPALRLRPARPDDAPAVAAIYAPCVTDTAVSFELEPPDAAEMRRRIEAAQAVRGWLVLEDGDQLAGYAYATPHRPRAAYRYTAEVSAYVAATHRRRGVARRLYTALFELLRLQRVHTALAGITLPNDASQGLHAALGFEAFARFEDVGYKFERWHTTEWWRLVLDDEQRPAELRPLDEVLASEAWRAYLAAERQA